MAYANYFHRNDLEIFLIKYRQVYIMDDTAVVRSLLHKQNPGCYLTFLPFTRVKSFFNQNFYIYLNDIFIQ